MRAGQEYSDGMADTATPAPDPTTDKPPRRRRWIPLSLRMFAAILVLLGGGSALLTWVTYRQEQQVYHRERQALHEIKSWGGHVGTERGGSQWLRFLASQKRLIDGNVLERISFILVDGKSLTDAGLIHLRGMQKLQFLYLSRTAVTDAGLKHLYELTGLKELRLADTQVTDAGVAELQRALPNVTIIR